MKQSSHLLKKYFTFIIGFTLLGACLCSSVFAVEPVAKFDFTKGKKGWSQDKFRDSNIMNIVQEKDGIKFVPAASGSMVSTFFTVIPTPKIDGNKLNITYRYRTAKCKRFPKIALSHMRGCGNPCSRKSVPLIADNQWHNATVELDFSGHKAMPNMHLEMIFEGPMDKSEYLEVSGITVTPVPPPAVTFYTYPRSGNIAVGTSMPEKISVCWQIDEGTHKLSAVLCNAADQKVIKKISKTGRKGKTVKFDFNVADGSADASYLLKLQVDGKAAGEEAFKKFTPAPNSFLVVDGTPMYRGKPFFMIGLYHVSHGVINRFIRPENKAMGLPEPKLENWMAEIAKRHFNVVFNSWGGASAEYHKQAEANHLMVINEFASEKQMEELKGEPSLLGWYPFDELKPEKAKKASKRYKKIKKIDPQHVVCSAFEQGGNALGDKPLVDMAFEDYYRIGGPNSDISVRAPYYKSLDDKILKHDPATCLIVVPQLFAGQVYMYFAEPTFQQLRAEVYLGIANGAKGIAYYSMFSHEPVPKGMELNRKRKHWYLPESKLWNKIGGLNEEVLKQQGYILSGKPVGNFSIKGAGISSRAWLWNGNVYLIAVNGHGTKTVNAAFYYPYGWKPKERLFDTGKVPTGKTVAMKPYDVMILKFTK